MAGIDFVDILGFVGGGLMVLTLSMRTIVPLRIVGILASIFYLLFAGLAGILPVLVQHLVMLPVNLWRLYEQLRLVKRLRIAGESDLSMDWLMPFMTHRTIDAGEVVFRKGDAADEMFVVISGKLVLNESGIEILPGAVVGELALLAPNRRRTQSLECRESAEVMAIKYDRVRSLYFQNPRFGFYFLRLTSARLFQNIAMIESRLESRDRHVAGLEAQLRALGVEPVKAIAQ